MVRTTETLCTPCAPLREDLTMNLKTIAALATTLIASSAFAGTPADKKCGAGTCGKKESSAKAGSRASGASGASGPAEAACSKKEGGKDAGCSKKEAGCSKKDGGCSKK